MTRLLIFIFALNAFITPVSATGVCDMMDELNSAMMTSSSMSSIMSDMGCEMDVDAVCSSVQCASNCVSTIIPIQFFEKQTLFIVAGQSQPQAGLAYFYKIVLPVNTPPPLV